MEAVAAIPQPKLSALALLVRIAVSPRRGLADLAAQPKWVLAFFIGLAAMWLGFQLEMPALHHLMMVQIISEHPELAKLPPDRLAARVHFYIKPGSEFDTPISYVKGLVIDTVLMVAFASLANRKAPPILALWAANANVTALTGCMGILCNGVIAYFWRDRFQNVFQIETATPSLIWLFHTSIPTFNSVLATITPFIIWGWALEVCAMVVIAGVTPTIALLTTVLNYIFFGLRIFSGLWHL